MLCVKLLKVLQVPRKLGRNNKVIMIFPPVVVRISYSLAPCQAGLKPKEV
jgi:hypothetical protein